MYLPVESQLSCPSAWLAAVKEVDKRPGHEAHNVIIDVATPALDLTRRHPIVAAVDDFLRARDKSVLTVANTIFPSSVYERHGMPGFFKVFDERVLPKVRKKNTRWSGYYFERMTNYPARTGKPINQLRDIVDRIKNNNPANNKYELAVFDPERDMDLSPYGGQCLSMLSFKLLAAPRRLALTAMYRNHYYIEKLLGNLIGLGRLMEFVAKEGDVALGPLTVISTHAEIDQPTASRSDVLALIKQCEEAIELKKIA